MDFPGFPKAANAVACHLKMSFFVHGMEIEGRFRSACLETGPITMLITGD